MEPPPCVQNAMMKQDKKPFTYTPGGIDLSEIRSPRMARRIERNANWDGVTEASRPQPPPSQNIGPLPPSTLAAMQPQMHVQVFPSGPPPPPPPLQALPTQKVVTSDNQVVERPDMTKIIPDNPMALLRKTGGPKPRPTFVDEMFNKTNQSSPIKTPPIQQQTFNVQPQQQQSIPQSPIKTPTLQRPKSFVEDSNNAQWSPPPPQQLQQQNHKPQPWTPPIQNSQQWSPPIIERQVEQPVKTSTAHIGSLYIPPVNQQQKLQPHPPSPPKRDPQSPQAQSPPTPTLKEAPRPWQKQQQQSQELPPWAKKETNLPPSPQIQQEQSPPIQQHRPPPNRWSNQRPASPKIEPPQQQQQQAAPNVVYVTQPLVFQHPGPQPNRPQQQQQQPQQQQKPKVDAQGARIIPIQIEGANQRPANKVNSPATPSNERSFNRQQSWNNTPTQSNSFKIIQKITQTDDDDDGNDNQQVIEHGPRYPQQFQQQQQQQIPTEQMRKMKLSEGDRELMNKLKQEKEEDPRYRGGIIPSRIFKILDEFGVDDENYLHNEIDPRYRGAAIPSKAFKLLQSMTDGTNDNSTIPSVSRGPAPASNKQTQVRTIPIQIERDETQQKYVPPSEQTVPEPKKYTGSAIPSRSFKILQAMTAPESCANANEVNEYNDPSSYYHWNYDPNYPPLPPPFPPFWPDYYHYYYSNCTNNNDNNINNHNPNGNNEIDEKNTRQTPVPFWGYYPPPPPPPYVCKQSKSDAESDSETARNTPLPFWGGYFPGYYPLTPPPDRENCSQDYQQNYAQYPPYWDPYYYHNLYYYGYHPPYGFYPNSSDIEDNNGYSSNDEKIKQFEEKSKSITPTILVTSTIPEELETKHDENKNDDEQVSVLSSSESDSETEVEDNEDNMRCSHPNGLQAIKSVADINVYDNNSDDEVEEEEENSEETDSASVYIIEDETIPHQLSVIFEESERTDTSKREMSVFSDSTTIADKTDNEEEEEEEISVSISLPLRVVKTPEITASFTLKTPESSRTVSRTEDHDNNDNEDKDDLEKIEGKEENKKEDVDNNEDDDEQDWWGIINKNEDDFYPRRNKIIQETYEEPVTTSTTVAEDCEISKNINEDANSSHSSSSSSDGNEDSDEDSSSSSSDSSSSKSISLKQTDLKQIKEEVIVEKEEPIKEMNCVENNEDKDGDSVKMLTIKERIQALKESIRKKEAILKTNEEDKKENEELKQKEEKPIKISVKEKVSAIENINGTNLLTTTVISTKSSVKSFEELSEEEGDSGVTSDMSRHISDNEEFPELRKMSRYQRAATHSRLYKLLQSECEDEDDDDGNNNNNNNEKDKDIDQNRRNQLSLPLESTNFDSNSNQTSPTSSINDKLINELVQSMLKRKKGQNFRHLPKEKLQLAAKRILQEEFDDLSSTPDSSFLSPLRNNTESSTPAQTPQEFYIDYKQYYDTWNDYDNMDIINNDDSDNDVFPSKAFRLLQEHTGLNRTGAIAGLLAKCPKILSSKNVHQELIKLIEQQSTNNDPIDTNRDAAS